MQNIQKIDDDIQTFIQANDTPVVSSTEASLIISDASIQRTLLLSTP